MAGVGKVKAFSKKKYKAKKKQWKGTNKLLPHVMSKAEKKYFDAQITTTATLVGSIVLLNGIGQSVAENARIGNRIDLKSVAYRLTLSDNSTQNDTSCRVCLVYDKEPTGALPAVTGASTSDSIFDSTIAAGVRAHPNLNNRDRYVILSDKLVRFQHQSGIGVLGALNPINIPMEKWKSLNTHTQYNAAGSAIGQINTGALYLILLSEVPAGANGEPVVLGVTRVRYTDQ